MQYEQGKEYIVRWKDSQNYSGWFNRSNSRSISSKAEGIITTRGICVGCDEEYLTLAQTNEDGSANYMNLTKILLVSIQREDGVPAVFHQKSHGHFISRVIIAVVIFAISLGFAGFITLKYTSEPAAATSTNVYVRGKYGKYCYVKGFESPLIKYPIYFTDKVACLNYGKTLSSN